MSDDYPTAPVYKVSEETRMDKNGLAKIQIYREKNGTSWQCVTINEVSVWIKLGPPVAT